MALLGVVSFANGDVHQVKPNESSSQVKALLDYGVRGHTFVIKERSLLEVIQSRLMKAKKAGKIRHLQQQFKKRVAAKAKRPEAVRGIKNTVKERVFYLDPTYTQADDVKDHKGNIVVKKGATVNPLEHLSWGEPYIFIDGDDPAHVLWAKQQRGKIILVKGSPLDLQDEHGMWFYFDQVGLLTEQFEITQVPAIVSQEGLMLKIIEFEL